MNPKKFVIGLVIFLLVGLMGCDTNPSSTKTFHCQDGTTQHGVDSSVCNGHGGVSTNNQ
jgi:hypothetical protein